MKHLLIVGARGWGREVYCSFINTDMYLNRDVDFKGFLDSKSDAFEGLNGNFPPILCSPENYEIQDDDVFFIAMGEPKWRKHYANLIENKGGKFITIICKNSFINPTATIGNGSFVSGWSIISDNVVVGNHVIIHPFCTLGHDVKIDDYSSIEAYCFFGGYSQMGKTSMMHVRSNIIPHKKIGNDVVVGSGSVVIKNVPDGQHVFGNPATKTEF